jgi:hypothetical protein
MSDFSFEHQKGFTPGELAGQVHLGKHQAHYEELFAEVIEDGVITPEERARLNRAADALGLDRMHLRRLEEALQAAYEARRHVRVRELADEEPAPASIVLTPDAAKTPHVSALKLRIAELESRVADLMRQLDEARAQVAVEVDLSAMTSATGGVPVEENAEELLRRLRTDPRDADALHGLYRVHSRADGDPDRQWLVAQALVFLGAADAREHDTYVRGRADGLIKPTSSVSSEGWKLLFHPDEEILTGQIFAVIVGAVLLGHVSALRRDKMLPKLDPERKQDPATSTLQAVRCFSWAGAVLGMAPPALYADPEWPGVVEMAPAIPPVARLGRSALAGKSPFELAFIAGRQLSWHREEHFVRLLVPSIPDLENLFLAALGIANAGIPMSAEIKRRVAPLARAIEPLLEPAALDRLRGHFLRFLDEGGRTNLQRWAAAADRTAARAGLLLANDLAVAHAVFEAEDPATARTKMDDLVVFVTSDRCAKLRKQIGIAVAAPR